MISTSIKQVASSLRKGDIGATALLEKCFQRANALKELNFLVTTTTDISRKQASEADRRLQNGNPISILDGVPVAVKDNFSTENVKTTCGSRMLRDYKPPYTATVVNKLVEHGAVLCGKTNLDEFAMGCGTIDSIHGPTRNPWGYNFNKESDMNDFHISGGSSGGSAVAVATGAVFGALGSDTGGSVRNPASYCGVIGLKPTYGRVSRHGLIPLVNSLDVPGIFGRTTEDVVHILNAIAGYDPLDSTLVTDPYVPITLPEDLDVNNLTVGIPKEYHGPGLCSEVVRYWNKAADLLEDAGARVVPVSLPHTEYSIVCYHLLSTCEIASNMARYDGLQYGHRAVDDASTEALYSATRHEGFNDVVRGRILAGNYFLLKKNYEKYFIQAQKVRRLISNDFVDVFHPGGVDVLLTPTTLSPAPLYSSFSQADNRTRTQEQDIFTQPANMAGVPAVSFPAGLSSQGLPIGLQLMSKPFHEELLLTVTRWLHEQLKCPKLGDSWLQGHQDS